jgi:hypothetical protein
MLYLTAAENPQCRVQRTLFARAIRLQTGFKRSAVIQLVKNILASH